jgi:hypothetical protein
LSGEEVVFVLKGLAQGLELTLPWASRQYLLPRFARRRHAPQEESWCVMPHDGVLLS